MLKAPKNAHLRQQSVFRINKLQNIVKELVSTEEQYVRVLFQFYYEVITPIREKKILKPHIVRECFPSMTNNLYTLHKCLLEDLRPITEWFQRDRELFNIMQQWLPGFGLYKNYIIEHHECLDRLKEEMKRTKKLRKFIDKACSRFSKSIDSYFIAPIQRLPRYILLFDEITKFQKGELVTLFDKTKMEIEQLTHDMNQTKKWFDQSKDGQQLLERQPVLRKVAVRLDNGMLDARVYFHTRVMLHDRTEPRAKKFRLHVLQMQIVLEPLQKTTLFQNALPKVLYFDQWFHYESTGDHCHFPNALLLFSSSYSGLISFEMRRDMQSCLDALKDISQYHTTSRKNILSSHTNRKIWVRCLVCQNEFADSGGNLEKTKCLSCGRWLCKNCCKESHQNKIVCEHCKNMFTKGSHIVQKVADPDKTNKTKHVRKGTPHSIKAKTFTPPHSPSSIDPASFDSSTQPQLIRSFSSPEIGGWTLIDDDDDEMIADPYTPDPMKADDQSGVTLIEYPSMAFRIEVSEQEDWSCSPRSDPARFTPLTSDPTNLLGENLQSDPEDMSEEDDSVELHSPTKAKSAMSFNLDPTLKPTRIGAFLASLRVEDFSRGSHRRSLTMGSSPLKQSRSPRVVPSRAFRPFKRHSLTDALFAKHADEAETQSLPSLARRKSLNDIDSEEVYATNIPLPLPSSVAIASDRRKRSESSEESISDNDFNHLLLPPHRDSISEESSAIGTVDLNFLGSDADQSESTRDSFYETEAKEQEEFEEEMADHHRRISSSDAQKRCSPDRTLLTTLSISTQNDLEIKPKVQHLQLSFQTSTSQNVLPDPFFEHFTYGTPITIAKPAPRKFSSQEKRDASSKSLSNSNEQDSGGSGGSSKSTPYPDFPRMPPRGRQTSPKRPGPPRKLTSPLPAQAQNQLRYPYPNRPISRKRPTGPHYTRRTIGTASEMHALDSSSDDYPPIPYRKQSEPYDTTYHSRGPPSTWRKPAYGPPNPYHPQPVRAQTAPRRMRSPDGVDFPRSPTGPRPVQNHANTVSPLQSLPSKFYEHMRQNETSNNGHLVPQHAQHSSRPLDRHPHRRPNVPQFSANQPLSHQYGQRKRRHTIHSVQKPKGVQTERFQQLRHGVIRKAFETYAFNNHLTSVGFQLALNDLGYPGSEFLSPANQPISFMQFVRIVAYRETE